MTLTSEQYSDEFKKLTCMSPLSWQWRLFDQFQSRGEFPAVIDLPTGLGKTMVMAIWLIARTQQPDKVPTRLIYVVDRRTVVDQASDVAEKLQKEFQKKHGEGSLAISTLRGQLADNREWSTDPSRPAIIIGTVDLIGSALLFSGYRSGFKRRPLEAGLLGQDSLLVLDEAHLSRPFEKLICRINNEGDFQKSRDRTLQGKPMLTIRMSATSGSSLASNRFTLQLDGSGNLTGEDANDPIIDERFGAKKGLTVEESPDVIESIANAAGKLAEQHAGSRIVVFVKSPKHVDAVRRALIKKDTNRENRIAQLTGTMRGLERDELVDREKPILEQQNERRVMQRFLQPDNDPSLRECFLISTSAGEVGFDLNADHLVGDAAPLDSWIQRLGRVNRRGKGDATVILVKDANAADKSDFAKACRAASELLTDGMDVSPRALVAFKRLLLADQLKAACTPEPTMVELTDILIDAWSMTSIIEPMPGRPEVGPWLRGIADDLPQTTIAWRAELDLPDFNQLDLETIAEWFDTHRVLPHETLGVPTTDAAKTLLARWFALDKKEQLRVGPCAVVVDRAGLKTLSVFKFIEALQRDDRQTSKTYDSIRYAALILPASFGGIQRGKGLLDADAPEVPKDEDKKPIDEQQSARTGRLQAADVADIAPGRPRLRELITKPEDGEPNSRRIGSGIKPKPSSRFVVGLEANEGERIQLASHVPKHERLDWGTEPQSLARHIGLVEQAVKDILARLALPAEIQLAVRLGAAWHDHGKNRECWQRCAGRKEGEDPRGKSGGRMKPYPRGYRHEFGSLRELAGAFNAGKLVDETASPIRQDALDLAMHLIATHHGRGRPHFPKGGFDPDCEVRSDEIHTESIRRFARLQRKYGWWHLAWLENLLRCADQLASKSVEGGGNPDDDAEAGE